MESKPIIKRWGPPNDMDKFPYGTRIEVHKNEDLYDLYIQSNKDEERPIWLLIGPFKHQIEYITPDN